MSEVVYVRCVVKNKNVAHLSFAFPFIHTKTACAPHEIQQGSELSAIGPRHPTGTIADENVSQRFRC